MHYKKGQLLQSSPSNVAVQGNLERLCQLIADAKTRIARLRAGDSDTELQAVVLELRQHLQELQPMHCRESDGARRDLLPMISLTYMSSAIQLLSPRQLAHLHARAEQRNLQHDVTGVLLYDEGSFMQCLEGPTDSVVEIYRIICCDPLHHNIFEMSRSTIAQREYGDWSMALRTVSGAHRTWGGDALTAKLTGGASTDSKSKVLLASFWKGVLCNPLHGPGGGLSAQ